MIKILLADDHSVVREGLKRILEQDSELKVIAEAENGLEVIQKVRSKNIDVVLLDMSMPEMSGLDCLKQVKSEFPDLPILVFSMHPEDQYEHRVMSAGASGFLTKRSKPEEIIQAIKLVFQNKKIMSEKLKEKLLSRKKITNAPHELLSDREFQVMKLICKGLRVKEMAYYLNISEKTVSTYRARIFEKLGVNSNAELVKYCIDNDIKFDDEGLG